MKQDLLTYLRSVRQSDPAAVLATLMLLGCAAGFLLLWGPLGLGGFGWLIDHFFPKS